MCACVRACVRACVCVCSSREVNTLCRVAGDCRIDGDNVLDVCHGVLRACNPDLPISLTCSGNSGSCFCVHDMLMF